MQTMAHGDHTVNLTVRYFNDIYVDNYFHASLSMRRVPCLISFNVREAVYQPSCVIVVMFVCNKQYYMTNRNQ